VLFLVEKFRTRLFLCLVCNDVFDLLEENAIFTRIIVIFENLVEL
jgi:hypothetical protein